jgi:hypothetical protein
MKFKLRSDMVLLQKIHIIGFDTAHQIPNGDYRIIDIQYDYADGGTTNEVTVSVIKDANFQAYLNLKRVYLNTVSEIQNIVNDAIAKQSKTLTGMITAIQNYQPMYAFTGTDGSNLIVTGTPIASLNSGMAVGATGPILGWDANTPTGFYTIHFSINSYAYAGTIPANKRPYFPTAGTTGKIISVKATVFVETADGTGGAGTALIKTGYCNSASSGLVNSPIVATPDSNGNYICTFD